MDNVCIQAAEIPLENLSKAQFLALATETTRRMDWVLGNVIQTGFVAYTCKGLFARNAEIKLEIGERSAKIHSKSIGNDVINVRENQKNIQNFISRFRQLKRELTTDELIPIYQKIKSGF